MDANLDEVSKVLSTLNPLFTDRKVQTEALRPSTKVTDDAPMSLFPDDDVSASKSLSQDNNSAGLSNGAKIALAASAATCLGLVVGLATGAVQSLARAAAQKSPIGKELLTSIANLPSLTHRRGKDAKMFDGDSLTLISPDDLWKRLNLDRVVFNLDTQRIENVTKFSQRDTLSFDTDAGEECVVWRYFRNANPDMFVCKVLVPRGSSFEVVERRYRLATTQELFYHGSKL